jgi:hypothetical protein
MAMGATVQYASTVAMVSIHDQSMHPTPDCVKLKSLILPAGELRAWGLLKKSLGVGAICSLLWQETGLSAAE